MLWRKDLKRSRKVVHNRGGLMPLFWHDLSWVLPLRTPFLTAVFAGFSALGDLNGYLLVILLLTWVWRPAFIHRLLPWLSISIILNGFLKDFFEDPRPDAFLIPGHSAGGYGMPSGHAQLAVLFWIAVAIQMRREKSTEQISWVAFIIAGMIGFSRMYLGVHDVQDIAVGSMLGFILLGLFHIFAPLQERLKPIYVIVGMLFYCSAAYLAWPGGPNSGTILPTFALLLGWYGSTVFFGPPQAVIGTAMRRWGAAALGLALAICIYTLFATLLGVNHRVITLFVIGVLAATWPRIIARIGGSRIF
jgi:membrane-associated phospholipid phosphatase